MSDTFLSRIATKAYHARRPERWHLDEGQTPPKLDLRARAVPRLILDRGLESVARRTTTKGKAWLTADALAMLETLLQPTDHVMEFGSGSSTAWLAGLTASVTSVEESPEWASWVQQRASALGQTNVDVRLVNVAGDATAEEHREAYVNAAPDLAEASLGMVLVDGKYRDLCALRAIGLLRSGGLLVLDNAETYLPTATRSLWRVERPASSDWARFVGEVAGWRSIWTTNGVWDTAIWIKP